MKKKNEGFTLIELVVIIAMMSIFIGIFAYNIGNITGYNAKECYKKLSSAITQAKVNTLGKAKETGDMYLQIYRNRSDDRVYIQTVTNGKSTTPVIVGKTKITKRSGVKVGYQLKGSSDVTDATDGAELNICFNRATGAIVNTNGTPSTLQYIVITAGSYKYTIELIPSTGKIVLTGRN